MLIGTRKGWPNFGPCSTKRWCCIRSLYRPRNSLHASDLSMRKKPLSLKKKKKNTQVFSFLFLLLSLLVSAVFADAILSLLPAKPCSSHSPRNAYIQFGKLGSRIGPYATFHSFFFLGVNFFKAKNNNGNQKIHSTSNQKNSGKSQRVGRYAKYPKL